MEKATKFIIIIVVVGIVLGIVLSPAMMVITGVALWVFILLILGGAEDDNPHRTAIRLYRGIPDKPLVRRAMKPVKVQKEKDIRGKLVWMLLISGAFLVFVGVYGMGI